MKQYIDVDRAAHLAGVKREEIQEHIASGRLPSCDGKVEVHDLLKIYPDVEITSAAMVDIVSQIKDDAALKEIHHKESLKNPKYLLHELDKQQREIDYYKSEIKRYTHIIKDLKMALVELQSSLPQHKNRIGATIKWLINKTRELW